MRKIVLETVKEIFASVNIEYSDNKRMNSDYDFDASELLDLIMRLEDDLLAKKVRMDIEYDSYEILAKDMTVPEFVEHICSMTEAEEKIKADRRDKGLCQRCGGRLKKGLLSVKCVNCGQPKDY